MGLAHPFAQGLRAGDAGNRDFVHVIYRKLPSGARQDWQSPRHALKVAAECPNDGFVVAVAGLSCLDAYRAPENRRPVEAS
jgi:hypothetical protein